MIERRPGQTRAMRGTRTVAARVVGRLPQALLRAIAGRRRPVATPHHDGGLEPEVAAGLRLLELAPGEPYDQLTPDQARARVESDAEVFGGRPTRMAQVHTLPIPTSYGTMQGRLYRAAARDADRLLLYFHGGGFVVGSLDSVDTVCRFIAKHAGVSVLSVEYRLAPEHPFPAAPEDALSAFEYAVSRSAEWGHDPALIGVAGDSAGGNLAAVLCQDKRRLGGVQPAFQLLFFPATDVSRKSATYREFGERYFLTERQVDWYIDHYLGETGDRADPRVSPLLAEDMSGLPPAYIAVAGFDVLRDEGEAYARRLAAAGVPVALRRHDGLIHAFVNTLGTGHTGREALLEACGAIRMALRAGCAPR